MSQEKCQMCQAFGIDPEDAGDVVEHIWMHHPFGGVPCRYVGVCKDCFEAGAADEPDETCPACINGYLSI